MRKTMMKNGKVLRLAEFVDEQIVELNVNYRIHNIRKKHMYEDEKDPEENVFEKVLNYKNNLNLDNDLRRARRDLLKTDFQNFLKLMNFTLLKKESQKKEKKIKTIKNKILRRFEIDMLLNEKKDHKNCFYFHYKKDDKEPDLSTTYNFKKMSKSKSASALNISQTNSAFQSKKSSPKPLKFDQILRNNGTLQKFKFNDSLKVSSEKAGFLQNRKQFEKKRDVAKKSSIILPSVKGQEDQSQIKEAKEIIPEKVPQMQEDIIYPDEENRDIIKRRILLPKTESPIRKQRVKKKGNTVKISFVLSEDEKSEHSNEHSRLNEKFEKSIPKRISLKKVSSTTHLGSFNKLKMTSYPLKNSLSSSNILPVDDKNKPTSMKDLKLFGAGKEYYFAPTSQFEFQERLSKFEESLKIVNNESDLIRGNTSAINQEENERIKSNRLSPKKWQKEREALVIKNITDEFSRLKKVRNDIHDTYHSALEQLIDKETNKSHKMKQKTADSRKSSSLYK